MIYPVDFTKRTFCVITGASRGIGRTIAVELARRAKNDLTFVLLARSESALIETKNLILNINKNVNVHTYVIDLSEATSAQYESIFEQFYKKSQYESAMIFHNAGQIGQIGKTSELLDKNMWRKYYDLNVFSPSILNAVFLKMVQADKISNIFVVNVTSLLGRKPFKYLSLYGSGKAARDIYFKVVAEEEPCVVVLNYSPGMVETDMADELVTNIKTFEDNDIVANSSSKLTTQETTNKMIGILEKGQFKSGDIIDYYD